MKKGTTGTVLVTGASGFVGQAFCRVLWQSGLAVRAAVRGGYAAQDPSMAIECVAVDDIGPTTDWSAALDGIAAVVHLAARVHVTRETARDPLAEYQRINVLGTERLAHQAIEVGVQRLVFVSTIGVHGDASDNRPFSEASPPRPAGPYALSKWEAEQRLCEVAKDGDLELVVVRPPLVYGPGAKGNVRRLLQLIDRGMPLPLESVSNRRSFIGLRNLLDCLKSCVAHPAAAGETFVVCDGEELSTPEFARRIGKALGKSVRLWPCPLGVLRAGAALTGQKEALGRLCASLTVDAERVCRVLGWTPPCTVDEEIGRMAAWWRSRANEFGLPD